MNKKRVSLVLFTILITVLTFLSFHIFRLSGFDTVKYIYFQVFFVIFQGFCILFFLDLELSITDTIIFAYSGGIILNVLEYYIFYAIKKPDCIFVFGNIVALLGIYVLIKKIKNKKVKLSVDTYDIVFLYLFMIIIFIAFLGFSLNNLPPDVLSKGIYNQDLLWNVGNIQSALNNFPIQDIRIAGLPFKYHFFMHIHMAVMSLITKIEPFKLYFAAGFIGKTFLLLGGCYVFGKNVFKKKSLSILFIFIYIFTSCASINVNYNLALNYNIYHILLQPFGLEMAVGFMLLCLTILMKAINSNKTNIREFILISTYFVFTLGLKGPVAIVLLGGMILFLIYLIILRKPNVKATFIYTASFSILLILLYKAIFGDGGSTLHLELGYFASSSFIGKSVQKILNGFMGKIPVISTLIIILFNFLFYLPFASLIYLCVIIYLIKKYKSISLENVLLFFLSLTGIGLTYILKHPGHSEMYFIMTAIPLMEGLAIKYLTEINKSKKLIILSSCLLVVGFISSFGQFKMVVMQGINNYKTNYNTNKVQCESSLNSITNSEYQGMLWLKNNTNIHDIILTDRQLYSDEGNEFSTSRYFYYSAFSGRRMYLEGWAYSGFSTKDNKMLKYRKEVTDKIYQNDNDALKKAQKDGVKYIIKTSFLNKNELELQNIRKVFENSDITIYKILN